MKNRFKISKNLALYRQLVPFGLKQFCCLCSSMFSCVSHSIHKLNREETKNRCSVTVLVKAFSFYYIKLPSKYQTSVSARTFQDFSLFPCLVELKKIVQDFIFVYNLIVSYSVKTHKIGLI